MWSSTARTTRRPTPDLTVARSTAPPRVDLASEGHCPSGTCNASFAIVATASGVGDSGGPWLGSGKAYGIHKAHSSTVGSIYSKIGYRPNGWAIYTG